MGECAPPPPPPREKINGAPGDFVPEMQKRALKIKKRAPENRHRLQCKSLLTMLQI